MSAKLRNNAIDNCVLSKLVATVYFYIKCNNKDVRNSNWTNTCNQNFLREGAALFILCNTPSRLIVDYSIAPTSFYANLQLVVNSVLRSVSEGAQLVAPTQQFSPFTISKIKLIDASRSEGAQATSLCQRFHHILWGRTETTYQFERQK